jgi:hypothetical protein
MQRVFIRLEEQDLLAIWTAVLDDDAPAALAFLKERIVPQVPAKGTAPCDSSRLNACLLRGEQRQRAQVTGCGDGNSPTREG